MPFESFVALRYLAASRRTAHVALISTISILGLAVGVAALVISLALLSGFQDGIRVQMARTTPHVTVSPERGPTLPDLASVRRVLSAQRGIAAIDAVVEGRGWLSVAGGSAFPVRFRNAPDGTLASGDSGEAPPARVAAPVAARIGLGLGETARLTSARTRLSPIGPVPISIVVRASAISRRGALEKSPDVEIPEDLARLLAGVPEGARACEATLRQPDDAERVAASVARELGAGYRVQTWRQRNAPLSFALRLEKVVIFATVALVIVVAALNVLSNVALLVVEKKRDLGVFRTMGAAPRALARIYLLLGAAIGALGTAGGVALGVSASILLDRFHAVPLPADVYLFTHVPFAVHPRDVLLVALFAMATAVGAAALPARAAARIAPAEAVGLSR